MDISNRKIGLNIILAGLLALLLVPACADDHKSATSGKGSEAMQAAQATAVEVTQETGKKVVKGQAQAQGVSSLEFDLSNGTVDCIVGNAQPGEVLLSWTITRKKIGLIKSGKPKDLEVVVKQDGGKLTVEDHWRGPRISSHPIIDIVITVHPDTLISGSLGNGKIKLENHRIAGLSLGNGAVTANGELVHNAGISLGNGEIKGSLLIADGNHDISVGNGAVKIDALEGSSFKLDSSVGLGDIRVEGVPSDSSSVWFSRAVSATIGSGQGQVDISAGNGQVVVRAL